MQARKGPTFQIRGFTLLELIIAIAILVLLAGVMIPLAKNAIEDAKVARIVSLIHNLKKVSMKYYQDTDQLPEDYEGGPHDLFQNNVGARWKGPYIDAPLASSQIPLGQPISVHLMKTLSAFGQGYQIGGSLLAHGTPGVELVFSGQGNDSLADKIDLAIDGVTNSGTGACVWDHVFPAEGDSGNYIQISIFLFKP